jgi:hypothetical protein
VEEAAETVTPRDGRVTASLLSSTIQAVSLVRGTLPRTARSHSGTQKGQRDGNHRRRFQVAQRGQLGDLKRIEDQLNAVNSVTLKRMDDRLISIEDKLP